MPTPCVVTLSSDSDVEEEEERGEAERGCPYTAPAGSLEEEEEEEPGQLLWLHIAFVLIT